MPARASNYYHWAADKPCTTNQVYGYDFRLSDVDQSAPVKRGPKDYARPFSNSGFFPQLTDDALHESDNVATARRNASNQLRSCQARFTNRQQHSCRSGPRNRTNINRGYVTGWQPITDKLRAVEAERRAVSAHESRYPVGVLLRPFVAPPSEQEATSRPSVAPPRSKEHQYLWHSLSGALVHVQNHAAPHTSDRYACTGDD